MSRCVIVVPCYNEALRLPHEQFANYAHHHPLTHFLFVNDGSTDQTQSVLESLRNSNRQQFQILQLPVNQGKAEAVRQGCLLAFSRMPELVGYWDADLATPLDLISDFLEVIDQQPHIELVCGARVRMMGRTIQRNPVRHYLGRLFAGVAAATLGLDLYDTQCGAKMFRPTSQIRFAFGRPFLTRWLFDIEILSRLMLLNRRQSETVLADYTYELPLREWRDVAGSKVKPNDFIKAFFELLTIKRNYYRQDVALETLFDLSQDPHIPNHSAKPVVSPARSDRKRAA